MSGMIEETPDEASKIQSDNKEIKSNPGPVTRRKAKKE